MDNNGFVAKTIKMTYRITIIFTAKLLDWNGAHPLTHIPTGVAVIFSKVDSAFYNWQEQIVCHGVRPTICSGRGLNRS